MYEDLKYLYTHSKHLQHIQNKLHSQGVESIGQPDPGLFSERHSSPSWFLVSKLSDVDHMLTNAFVFIRLDKHWTHQMCEHDVLLWDRLHRIRECFLTNHLEKQHRNCKHSETRFHLKYT